MRLRRTGVGRNDAQAAAFGAREEADAGESRSERSAGVRRLPPRFRFRWKSKGRVCGPRPWAAAWREVVRRLRADTCGIVSTGGAPLLCRGALSVRPVSFCQRGFSLSAHFWRHFSTKGLYVINCWTLRGPGEVSLSLMSSWTNRGGWLLWPRSHGGQVWTEKRAISSCSQSGSLGLVSPGKTPIPAPGLGARLLQAQQFIGRFAIVRVHAPRAAVWWNMREGKFF